MQIHQLRSLSKMSADPVSDVVHSERTNTFNPSNLVFRKSMKRGEVSSLGKLGSDRLESDLRLFEQRPRCVKARALWGRDAGMVAWSHQSVTESRLVASCPLAVQ